MGGAIMRDDRTIVIAGGGTAGWMAAAAFARFVTPGWRVALVESDAIGTVGVGEATIPQIRLFNRHLGLDEDQFLRETQGTIKLGIEFRDWTQPGHAYLHGFGDTGRPLGLLPFHHYWLRAQAEGWARDFGDYSLNSVAALKGRFARFEPQGPVPPMPYAFHFDAGLYAAFLRRFAEARGVVRYEGRIVSVERNAGGDIAALLLDGERRVAGDLFVDCTGFRALLIGETLGAGYEDWSRWLPCDRALAVASARTAPPIPYTRATARKAGWQWRIPLQHRTGNGYVYSSRHISDDEAAATLLDNLDGEALGDPRPLRFVAGKRQGFWRRNCVAVGLSSGFLEPLESTSIHLIQTAIARILAFLPAGNLSEADRAEYDRLTHLEYEYIRDFLVLHYHANGRVGEALWDDARASKPPPELARKLALWRSSARVSRRDEELFAEPGWTQVLIGQGVLPAASHPLADAVAPGDLKDFLDGVAQVAERVSAAMPAHADLLARVAASPPQERLTA
ncbi:tryptophan halogenase family protein [Sphingomonas sp.]